MTRNHGFLVLGGVFVVLGVLVALSGGCHFTIHDPGWHLGTFVNNGTYVNGVELPFKNTLHYSSLEQMQRFTLDLPSAPITVEGDPKVTGVEATFEVREHTAGDASLGPAPDSIAVKSATGNPVLVTSAKVRVPPGTIVEVSTSLGSVTVSGIRGVSLVSAKTDAGRVELRDLHDVPKVTAKSSLGQVSLATASGVGDVSLDTDSGAVSIKDVTGAATVKCTTNLGAVEAASVEASDSLTAKSDCGAIELKDVKTGRADLRTSLGGVSAQNSTFDHLEVHTDAGAVRLRGCTYKTKDIHSGLGGVSEKQ